MFDIDVNEDLNNTKLVDGITSACRIMHRLFRGQKRIIKRERRSPIKSPRPEIKSADTNYVIVDRNEGLFSSLIVSAYYLLRDTVKRQTPRGYKYGYFVRRDA